MRTLIHILMTATLVAAAPAAAQTPSTEKHYPLGLENLLTGITLTPKQRAQVDSIADQYWMKLNAMPLVPNNTPMEKRRAALKDQREHIVADVEKVLTAKQVAEFRKNMEETRKP